jgi:O-antigen/teichoic acid export membrane protein
MISMIRGVLLFILTVAVAFPVSVFFNSKASFNVILVAALIPLASGFENPAVAKFQKYLDFHKEFFFRFLIAIFDVLVGAGMIIIYKSSLALIVAVVFTTLFETILSFLVISPRPKFVWEKDKITKLFHFGKWLTAISSLNYFVEQMDSIVVGKLLGVGSLGIYELAQKYSWQIMTDAGLVFSKVTFPLFSRIKTDNARTKRALNRVLLFSALIFGTATIVLFIFSKEILLLFAGTRWLPANIPLKIFSLTGLVTAFMAIITSLFLARGRQDLTAKIIFGRLIILGVLIIPASLHFGIIGTSSVSLLSYLLVLPIAIWGLKEVFKQK